MGVYENFYENKRHGEPDFPIRLYESFYDGFKDCYLHWHKEFEIMHIIKGCADIYIDGQIERAHPDDLILINKNCLHHIKQLESNDVLRINATVFDMSILRGLDNDYVQESFIGPLLDNQLKIVNAVRPDDAGYNHLVASVIEIENILKTKPLGYQILVKSELFRFVYNLMKYGFLDREESPVKDSIQLSMIKQAAAYISEHLEDKLTIKKLAELFGYSEFHFARLFKKHTGNSINTFISNISMNKAKHLLTYTELSLEDIAQKIGYSSASYFIQIFKQQNSGLTPKKYRLFEQNKKNNIL